MVEKLVGCIVVVLLAGCSSVQWKAQHPEDVVKTCHGRELHIGARVEGSDIQTYRELDTQCGTGDDVTHSNRVDAHGHVAGSDLLYKDRTEEGSLKIHERVERTGGTYEHSYERRAYSRSESGAPSLGTRFRFRLRVYH